MKMHGIKQRDEKRDGPSAYAQTKSDVQFSAFRVRRRVIRPRPSYGHHLRPNCPRGFLPNFPQKNSGERNSCGSRRHLRRQSCEREQHFVRPHPNCHGSRHLQTCEGSSTVRCGPRRPTSCSDFRDSHRHLARGVRSRSTCEVRAAAWRLSVAHPKGRSGSSREPPREARPAVRIVAAG